MDNEYMIMDDFDAEIPDKVPDFAADIYNKSLEETRKEYAYLFEKEDQVN